MTFDTLKPILDKIPNGRIFKVDMTTDLASKVSASAKKLGYVVKKHTTMPCRKGIEYSNTNYINMICNELGYTIGSRANGIKDTANKGFADSTLGNKLVDLFSVDCKADRLVNKPICSPKVEYIVSFNGTDTIVSKAELKALGIMQNSFFNEQNDMNKYNEMLTMKAEWELDKASYPHDKKDRLAKLIRDMYNKMFSVKVENINAIG